MDNTLLTTHALDTAVAVAPADFCKLAPRPTRLAETGLEERFVGDLVLKHLLSRASLSFTQLCQRTALAGSVLEPVLTQLRRQALVESQGLTTGQAEQGLGLTDRGRVRALNAMQQGGYVGPAPVPLNLYRKVVAAQSIRHFSVTPAKMAAAFEGLVIRPGILEQLGPAVVSGRSLFIYGPAGTGKTFLSQRLTRLFDDSCLIPAALLVEGQVVQVFDPLVHHALEPACEAAPLWQLDGGFDPRFVHCERPRVVTGGELRMDMLEVYYDPFERIYRAPLQLKANNGLFIIDDMGRQHARPAEIFNRWIVPLEEQRDFLSLGAGRHFETPFDEVLIFSSNINPLELADEAFLRRIGYKVEFTHLDPGEYRRIWHQEQQRLAVPCEPGLADLAIEELHRPQGVSLCPCHPRDLLNMASDLARYQAQGDASKPLRVTEAHLRWAWKNYFVSLDNPHTSHQAGSQRSRGG